MRAPGTWHLESYHVLSRLLIATTNHGKLREIREILAELPVEIVTLDAFPDLGEPDEHGSTFAENARAKAVFYAAATGLPAVADDSGLEIDAMDGEPGVRSARFGGADATYPERFKLIAQAMAARPDAPPTARFVCAVALAEGDTVRFESRGVVEGVITDAPRGTGGFGYDPIFLYPPLGLTLAEVPQWDKSEVSHRGKAFRELRQYLEGQGLEESSKSDVEA